MQIENMQRTDAAQAAALYNASAEGELVYKKVSEEEFVRAFMTDGDGITKLSFAAKAETGTVCGFAGGCLVHGKNIAYITFVLVDRAYRRQGIGSALLSALEQALLDASEIPLEKYQMIFFNPAALTWIVPGTRGHDHPNAPGVDVASDAYIFFKNQGYMDRVFQNSFYLPLADFAVKPEVQAKMDALPEHVLSICFYDAKKHYGMEELFDDLGNEAWKEEILSNIGRPDGGDPVIIAEHKGKVVGFTGPIRVQESGRGYFAGIGVHSEYRQYGLGKSLFSTLCLRLKEIGAGYMTLFTGETNPARRIYRSAGFKIVKTWSDMEKSL